MKTKLAFLLITLLISAGYTAAQGTLYQLSPPAPNARVLVCPSPDNGYPCPVQAAIFSDVAMTQAIAQPVNVGSSGFFSFYIAAGTYVIQITGPGYGAGNRQTVTIGSVGTPGGANLQGQINNSGALGGTSCFNLDSLTGPLNFDCDTHPKGPNPYVDVTRYGVRSTSSSVAPAVPGITATISATSTSATLSAASSLQNGDGVDVFGAGAACTLAAPTGVTVTPSVAAAPTGLGLDVAAPTGATTYNYQVWARDKAGCQSAASTIATTTTGSASLGSQSVSISGFTRSGSTVTATTSSAHGLVANAHVYITGTTNADNGSFGGWYTVVTAPDTTHFTYLTGQDTAEGAAATSAGGGTVFWWNDNHVTWTQVSGTPLQYFVASDRGGAGYKIVCVSRLQNFTNSVFDTTCDDFGATMMAGVENSVPYFISATPPVSSVSAPLVTTIASGAGTTTLTLANAATTSVTNATILFDNTPNIQTAASHVSSNGLLYFPAGTYVTNSFLTMPLTQVNLAGANLYLNDTMQVSQFSKFFGMLGAQAAGTLSFGWQVGGNITAGRANSAVWSINGNGESYEGIQLNATANGSVLQTEDGSGGGAQVHWKNVNYAGAPSVGYMDINLLMRGGFWNDFDHVSFNTGPGQAGGGFSGSTSTPSVAFMFPGAGNSGSQGALHFTQISMQDRGMFYNPAAAGGNVTFDGTSRMQGGITPFFMLYNTGGDVSGAYVFHDVQIDTEPHALFAYLGTTSGTMLGASVTITGAAGSTPTNGYGILTGKPMALAIGNVSGQNNNAISNSAFTNNIVSITGNGEFMTPISTSSAPSAVVSAGGSSPIGTFSYVLSFVAADGQQSTASAFTNYTTTTGNQTITVTPPSPPTGAVGWLPYRCNAGGVNCGLVNGNGGTCSSPGSFTFSQTFVDNGQAACGNGIPTINRAGAQSLSTTGLSGTAFNLTGGGFKSTQTFTGTANHTVTWPDAAGPVGLIIPFSFTTTAATSDNVTVTGMTSSGHCSLQPTNPSADTLLTGTYVSAKTTNQITVTHAATSGATFDGFCSPN